MYKPRHPSLAYDPCLDKREDEPHADHRDENRDDARVLDDLRARALWERVGDSAVAQRRRVAVGEAQDDAEHDEQRGRERARRLSY